MTTGFLFLNKPQGLTSHDVIDKLRQITGLKKIGHAGTLDPLATGLLIIGVNRAATKKLALFTKMNKVYTATFSLGKTSDTGDQAGFLKPYPITKEGLANLKDLKEIADKSLSAKALLIPVWQKINQKFTGRLKQLPPMYSAKKIKGLKLYELARKGVSVKRKPQLITIYKLELLSLNFSPTTLTTLAQLTGRRSQKFWLANNNLPSLTLRIYCSCGTYIRALAEDLGQDLGTGAYLSALKREQIGKYTLKQAVDLNRLNEYNWSRNLQNINIKVLVFGTFDGLHSGHKNFFQQARSWGSQLVVAVSRDKIVKKIKGKEPHLTEKKRLTAVKRLALVDKAILAPADDRQRFAFIKKINPDYLCLGYDQDAYTNDLESDLIKQNISATVVRLKPFKPEVFKSSKVKVKNK